MPYGTELAGPIRVLHVDDDPALAVLVAKALSRRGHSAVHVTDGETALARLADGGFDVVALDHSLAGETGLDILGRIGPRDRRPPIVYVTGSVDARLVVEALKSGADDYVVKDLSGEFFDLLVASLEQAYERRRLKRARAENERLVREAKERAEILLREVNHRVANSLGLVAAMVRMQASVVADPQARHALQETQSRISAVAGVHRHLYSADQIGAVETSEYLHHLIEELGTSLHGSGAKHRIETRLARFTVTTDKAVALGVIVGELVTNAFKYAYPADVEGVVRVVSEIRGDGVAAVAVEDDGVGWDGTGTPQGTGLGSKITRAMARTLDATVEHEKPAVGTRVSIVFRLD